MTTLLSTLQSGSVTLTLSRPERANAFNTEMAQSLLSELIKAENDSQVKCVVITGAGNVFSAGQDIKEMVQGQSISYRDHLEKTYNPLILQIRKMNKPVIAAVNGACAGAAFGIALACDLRIAKSSAYFVVGFSGIGLAPDSGISLFLPHYIGLGRAQEYFYSNQKISAQLAYEWRIVNLVGGFNYQALIKSQVQKLVAGPLEAFGFGKQAFNQAVFPNLEAVLANEGIIQDEAGKSANHQEGIKAFLEKRKPQYK